MRTLLSQFGVIEQRWNIGETASLSNDQMLFGSIVQHSLNVARFPERQVGGLLEDYAHYARGEAATVYPTINDVTNISATSFEQFVDDYKMIFLIVVFMNSFQQYTRTGYKKEW